MICQRKRKKFGIRDVFIISFLAYPILLFIVFYVIININSIRMAFMSYAPLTDTWTFNKLTNFKEFIGDILQKDNEISICLQNSIKVYFINLIICMPLYLIFSYLLFKKCFMHQTIRTLVMIPQVVSGTVICLLFVNFISGSDAPLVMIFEKIGFVDEYGQGVGLLDAPYKYSFATTVFYGIWISFATSLIVYPNAMKEIDSAILESAQIDGVSNTFQEMFYIILPLIFPTISTFLVTGFAGIFTEGGVILAFYDVNAPHQVENMGYYFTKLVLNSKEIDYPLLSAGGLLMTLVAAPFTILLKNLLEKYGPSTEA